MSQEHVMVLVKFQGNGQQSSLTETGSHTPCKTFQLRGDGNFLSAALSWNNQGTDYLGQGSGAFLVYGGAYTARFCCCFAFDYNSTFLQVLSEAQSWLLLWSRDDLYIWSPATNNAFRVWQNKTRNEREKQAVWSKLLYLKERHVPCLSYRLLSCQTSSQMSRGPGAPRGVLHAFSQSPKLQNASSAAALGSRPGKHAERPVSKGSAAAWKKTPINTGRFFSKVSFLSTY